MSCVSKVGILNLKSPFYSDITINSEKKLSLTNILIYTDNFAKEAKTIADLYI